MEISVINQAGEEKKKLPLNSAQWSTPLSRYNVSLVNRYYLSNQRQGTKKVKSRGEIKGSTRKIYRQKGTGGARHGHRYAPQFVGGGVAFGPTGEENYSLDINKKLKKKFLQSLLGEKIRQQGVIVLDKINLDAFKASIEQEKMQKLRELIKGEFKGKIKEEAEKTLKTDTPEGYRTFVKKINENVDLYKELVRQKEGENNAKQFLYQIEKLVKEVEKLRQLADSYKTKLTEILLTNLLFKDLEPQIEKLKQEVKVLKTIPKKTIEQKKQLAEKERELTKLKKKMKQKTKTLIVLACQEEKKAELTRSLRNLPYVSLTDSKIINSRQLLGPRHILFTQSA